MAAVADARARALERSAAAGDVEAQARALVDRVRRGELAAHMLRLMAYVGDEAARLAVGPDECYWTAVRATDSGEVVSEGPERGYVPELRRWALGLHSWSRWVLARAALAAATDWARDHLDDPRVVKSLPGARRAIETLEPPDPDSLPMPWHQRPSWEPVRQAWIASRPDADRIHAINAIIDAADRPGGEQLVRAAIRAEIVEWAVRRG